jgi:hypothetical protein
MADTKISALPASTTPLAGTEVLPIVQSGVTRQVSVANLTAGRAVSAASVTASTGNFVVGTSGQGIDFSATPGTGTSELFSDYEEGTCSLAISDGTLSSSTTSCTYTRVGRQVSVQVNLYNVNVSALSNTATLQITGMPFNSANADRPCMLFCPNSLYFCLIGYITSGTVTLYKVGNNVDSTFLTKNNLGVPTNLSLLGVFTYFA